MKLNDECIRDSLAYIIDNIDIEIINNIKIKILPVTLSSIINSLKQKYTEKDIWYSVYFLNEGKYIESKDLIAKSKTAFSSVEIFNVTIKGYEFYATILPKTNWKKTQSVLKSIGVYSLDFITQTAQMVAVESAKQAVTIVMTGQGNH